LQLLNNLKQFSDNLVRKAKDLEGQLNNLAFEARSANVRVHNSFNQLLSLSHAQFIENVRKSPLAWPFGAMANLLLLSEFTTRMKLLLTPLLPPPPPLLLQKQP